MNLAQASATSIPLPDASAQCAVTSPPYWNLRNYASSDETARHQLGNEKLHDCLGWASDGERCGECYVCHMTDVMHEVRRVLRPDGLLFLNLGDSYNGSGGAGGDYNSGGLKAGQPRYSGRNAAGLKAKDLSGIPWRMALALQADGWWLRRDVIWRKPNPMPESPADRPSTEHEYIFILSKSQHYFYDQESMADANGTAIRSVWNIATQGLGMEMCTNCGHIYWPRAYRRLAMVDRRRVCGECGRDDAWLSHYAVFPDELARTCILLGTSKKGRCPDCGAPWQPVVQRDFDGEYNARAGELQLKRANTQSGGKGRVTLGRTEHVKREIIGWETGCDHDHKPVPCIVLDPFSGSGTTARVAAELGRVGIGLELSMKYIKLAQARLDHTQLGMPL